MKGLFLLALLAAYAASLAKPPERTRRGSRPVFIFTPDSLGQNYNHDSVMVLKTTFLRFLKGGVD
jgi:hypothetical protein